MKLKQRPDDFQVEELTDVTPSEGGDFALYRLEKRGWTTPDALALVRRRWKIETRRLSYGGLKDRHAATQQLFTILRGPRRNLDQQNVAVTYLGQVFQAYTSQDIQANRFRLVLRDLRTAQADSAMKALEAVQREGVPNYFDDQRFGSVGGDGEFIARLMVLERYEEALKLALTAPYEFDRVFQKREKATLLTNWGDWSRCREALSRGHARDLVHHLCLRPGDFRGALERLRPELGGLYLSAYQGHLWNRTLALYLERLARPEQVVMIPLRLGDVPFHRSLDTAQMEQLASAHLPLASARMKLDPGNPHTELIEAVLKDEGCELEQLRLKRFRRFFFSRGERPALCVPQNLAGEIDNDEVNPGLRKMALSFDLPRGSYATLVVKRLMARN